MSELTLESPSTGFNIFESFGKLNSSPLKLSAITEVVNNMAMKKVVTKTSQMVSANENYLNDLINLNHKSSKKIIEKNTLKKQLKTCKQQLELVDQTLEVLNQIELDTDTAQQILKNFKSTQEILSEVVEYLALVIMIHNQKAHLDKLDKVFTFEDIKKQLLSNN